MLFRRAGTSRRAAKLPFEPCVCRSTRSSLPCGCLSIVRRRELPRRGTGGCIMNKGWHTTQGQAMMVDRSHPKSDPNQTKSPKSEALTAYGHILKHDSSSKRVSLEFSQSLQGKATYTSSLRTDRGLDARPFEYLAASLLPLYLYR